MLINKYQHFPPVWRDMTAAINESASHAACLLQRERQTLANLLRQERWTEALVLAIKLNQPMNAQHVSVVANERPRVS